MHFEYFGNEANDPSVIQRVYGEDAEFQEKVDRDFWSWYEDRDIDESDERI